MENGNGNHLHTAIPVTDSGADVSGLTLPLQRLAIPSGGDHLEGMIRLLTAEMKININSGHSRAMPARVARFYRELTSGHQARRAEIRKIFPSKLKTPAEHRRGHAISLADPPDVIRQTILEAVTDSGAETRFAWASPGVKNLLTLFEVLSGKSRSNVESHFEGKGYQNLKTEVADLVIAALAPVRVRYLELVNNPVYLDEILQRGCEKVSPIAFATLDNAKKSMGIKNERSLPICLKPKPTTMTGHSRFSG